MKELLNQLHTIMQPHQVLEQEPLKNHTTFKIGGPADVLLLPETTEEVGLVITALQASSCPYLCLGNGSNVLVSDLGFRGAVIKFGSNFSGISRHNNQLIVQAGALLKDVSHFAAQESLTGMEFAVGIPGSMGGAVFMNAGAYDGDISQAVSAVTAVMPDGTLKQFHKGELEFRYRHSIFQDNGALICEVTLELTTGVQEAICERMKELTDKREAKQPLDMPSAGSTFKRPPGHFAGTLIEQTGLKGLKVGGAMVSEKHAGFVINSGNATAQDVKNLIQEVQKKVFEKHGVMLYPEVKMIGEEE